MNLEGSVSLAAFRSKLSSAVPKDHDIIFYCAGPAEASAAGQAAEYRARARRRPTLTSARLNFLARKTRLDHDGPSENGELVPCRKS
jgi:hypothetical protein